MAAGGATSYSVPITLSIPVGTGYQAVVAWRATLGSGSWGSWSTSPGSYAVTPGPPSITVSAPTAASSWKTGSTQTVAWTLSTAVGSGEFRVWLVSSGGTWYIGKQVLPTAGLTSYSTPVTVTPPAGSGYKAYVYYRPTVGSGTWTATAQSAAFTITP